MTTEVPCTAADEIKSPKIAVCDLNGIRLLLYSRGSINTIRTRYIVTLYAHFLPENGDALIKTGVLGGLLVNRYPIKME